MGAHPDLRKGQEEVPATAALPMESTSDQTTTKSAKLSDPALLALDSLYPTQIGLPGPGVTQLREFVLNKGTLLCKSVPLCGPHGLEPEDSNLPIAPSLCRETMIHTCDCVAGNCP